MFCCLFQTPGTVLGAGDAVMNKLDIVQARACVMEDHLSPGTELAFLSRALEDTVGFLGLQSEVIGLPSVQCLWVIKDHLLKSSSRCFPGKSNFAEHCQP